MERFFATIFVLVIPGIVGILYSLWLLKGGGKAFYMARHMYAGRVYAGIPWSLSFLIWAIAAIPDSNDLSLLIIFIGGGFGVLGAIFYVFQPSFLKPAWLKWLEREHGDIMHLLVQDVQELGDRVWQERVKTQAGLEEWVAEVRRKHGYKPLMH